MKKILTLLVAVMLLFTMTVAWAKTEVISPTEDFWFYDENEKLSDATVGEIFFSNDLLYKECGAEVVIVVIPTTGDMSIADYSYELFNSWGIGGDDCRGMLVLMAYEDEDYYITPGTALNTVFTSSVCTQYGDDYLESYFAAGDLDGGAKSIFEAIFARVADHLNAKATTAQGVKEYKKYIAENGSADTTTNYGTQTAVGGPTGYDAPERADDTGKMILGFIVLVFIVLAIINSGRRRVYRVRYHAPMPRGYFFRPWRRPPHPYGPGPFAPPHGPYVPPHGHSTSFCGPQTPRPMGGSGSFGGSSSGRSSYGGSSSGRSSFGSSSGHSSFGGSSRSSFGGSSSSRSSFGGASRGSSSRSGGFTRGGGGGRSAGRR